ncbi:MAG TPA: hypothetical protein VFN09_06230 [Rhodanobacteraceae bacterium]|nr:hypothetical protein [Rhodanobacteraceae bacterium]
MKIQASSDQLVIDNSLAMPVIAGIVLALGGLAIGLLGFLNHLWWLYLLAAALIVIGTLVIAFAKSTHVVLAKSGDSRITAKTLFGQAQSQRFALTGVTTVQLSSSQRQRRRRDADGSDRYDTEVTSVIDLKTGTGGLIRIGSETRTLSVGGLLGSLIQSIPLQDEAKQIADFIGVPVLASEATDLGTGTATTLG